MTNQPTKNEIRHSHILEKSPKLDSSNPVTFSFLESIGLLVCITFFHFYSVKVLTIRRTTYVPAKTLNYPQENSAGGVANGE